MDGSFMDDLYKAMKQVFYFAVVSAILIPVLIGVIVYLIVSR